MHHSDSAASAPTSSSTNPSGLRMPKLATRLAVWSAFALLLLLAPKLFQQPSALSLLSQIGTMMIFALSYNMLLGQGGMLSFGHAVYSGLAAFMAAHAMNLADAPVIPVSLIPLFAGFCGLAVGVLFGYLTTKKSGTTFAMITLGMVELVAACSLMFPQFFGGEGGITTNRVQGAAVLGISFGPQIQVYYLIAAYLFLATLAMFAFTQTPLGRMINAVRDNPERVEFLGYDSQWVRYLSLILSAFFAGIAGGLGAINFEIVGTENVSAVRSGAVLLFTFIGGVRFFFGPMLGAVVGVLLSVVLPEYTKAWQLYLGLFFMAMVLYAPGGLASLVLLAARLCKPAALKSLGLALLRQALAAGAAFVGLVLAIEMLYQHSLESANGSVIQLFGQQIDSAKPISWLIAATCFVLGCLLLQWGRADFSQRWSQLAAASQHGGGK